MTSTAKLLNSEVASNNRDASKKKQTATEYAETSLHFQQCLMTLKGQFFQKEPYGILETVLEGKMF
jgi:hypothetical protein